MILASGCSYMPWRNDAPEAEPPPPPEAGEAPVVIDPQVERREIETAKIDTENWEAGAYVGSLSVEDFEVNLVYGARIAYHLSEDFFAEAHLNRGLALTALERRGEAQGAFDRCLALLPKGGARRAAAEAEIAKLRVR